MTKAVGRSARGRRAPRIAALYDIHGNLPALEAVLADVERADVDEIIVGGDVIPGPMPRDALDTLAALTMPVRWLRGNGEREVLATRDAGAPSTIPDRFHPMMRWVADEIGAVHAAAIARWPESIRVDGTGVGTILFCHATPTSDAAIFTRRTSDERLQTLIGVVDADVLVCGHTHMPADRHLDGVRIVTAGSVGMPFGRPGAHWVLIGDSVEHRHVDYDLMAAATRVRETRYPLAGEFAESNVLRAPTEEEMLGRLEPGAAPRL